MRVVSMLQSDDEEKEKCGTFLVELKARSQWKWEMGSKENWTIEVSVWGNLEDPGDYERRERMSGKLGY